MSIPGAPALLRPLLARHEDGQEHVRRNLRAELARDFGLTEEDQTRRLPGANQPIFHTNLNNAAFHLTRAGLLEAPSFGATRISPRGRQVLDEHQTLNLGIVASIASERADEAAQEEAGDAADELSPEEAMKALDEGLRASLAEEILARILAQSPTFFERIVLDVLVRMGYGGSREAAAEHLGRVADGGVDGVIREDALGTDLLYVQAKPYARERTIGVDQIDQFIGALQAHGVRRGVLMATCAFTRPARERARQQNVALVDGDQLAELMIRHDVGAIGRATHVVKALDEDYFA